jgi:DNA-binding GntR family transcriptional regulator
MPKQARKTSILKPARSSAAEAYERLISDIECGNLAPGTRLREVELAARLKISRTPVREALKRLELQGLVAHEPHHGAVVTSLDYGQITELYLLREVLEGTAARLAAQHATEVEIGVLQRMVERDRHLKHKPKQLAENNRKFHQQIRDSARNRFVTNALENLRLSLALLSGTTLGFPGRADEALEEHSAIVSHIARHDSDGAEAAARYHIRNAFRTRIELQQDRPRLPYYREQGASSPGPVADRKNHLPVY